MFLIDSITKRRSTEPTWFRFFRNFFAIILTGIIMYYLITQLEKIDTEASTIITLKTFQKSQLNITLRTGISNEMEILSEIHNETLIHIDKHKSNQDIYLNYYNDLYSIDQYRRYHFDISIITNNANNGTQESQESNYYNDVDGVVPINTSNDSLSLSFESFQFFTEFDGTEPVEPSLILERRKFSLYLGYKYMIYFKPIIDINKYYDNILELNLKLQQIPIESEPGKIRLEIYPCSMPFIVRYENTRKYDFTNLISSLGGFYGAIAGIFVLLFGMNKHEPWGLAQKYIFSCTTCRRSLKRRFARKYVSSAGIPLVEKVNQRPKKSKDSKEPDESLEGRVQILETLLKDYYLDVYYLEKVKEVITNYEDSLKRLKNENDESIDEKTESIDGKTEVEVPIDEFITVED